MYENQSYIEVQPRYCVIDEGREFISWLILYDMDRLVKKSLMLSF
jgi:hypothetical protein